ncbi:uncharacterized protein LACBIDRAFT_333123 [Laccaria bicolor S238N-H82]|uniref:Predicted protein n=1 Tax=Laccaria bicolor (strain S238N-H82 / ATCC MYA-4686) TaxID=486041 RepID=B0DUY8_LACBS|nr:uncharacterized protein LACBIDRAFT_333123 [Laccaria bicolor S238N-H82]EDR01693.1 predicted protein [Laccaria bicolor S238N-H82]|eukprot:XP_001887769.1 predicted protein [Laccaria bicolor S238N-H82]
MCYPQTKTRQLHQKDDAFKENLIGLRAPGRLPDSYDACHNVVKEVSDRPHYRRISLSIDLFTIILADSIQRELSRFFRRASSMTTLLEFCRQTKSNPNPPTSPSRPKCSRVLGFLEDFKDKKPADVSPAAKCPVYTCSYVQLCLLGVTGFILSKFPLVLTIIPGITACPSLSL